MLLKTLLILLTILSSHSYASRGGAYLGLAEFERYSDDALSLGAFLESSVGRHTALGIQGEYWKINPDRTDRSLRDLSFAAYGKLYIPTGTIVTPFFQGGLGLHFLENDTENSSDSDRELGVDVALGALIPLSDVSLSIAYQIRDVDFLDYSQFMVSVSSYM